MIDDDEVRHDPDEHPIAELAGFGLEPDPEFTRRVRRSIERRRTAAELVRLGSQGFLAIVFEFADLLPRAFSGRRRNHDEEA